MLELELMDFWSFVFGHTGKGRGHILLRVSIGLT